MRGGGNGKGNIGKRWKGDGKRGDVLAGIRPISP